MTWQLYVFLCAGAVAGLVLFALANIMDRVETICRTLEYLTAVVVQEASAREARADEAEDTSEPETP